MRQVRTRAIAIRPVRRAVIAALLAGGVWCATGGVTHGAASGVSTASAAPAARAPHDAWLARAQAHIAQREYRASHSDGRLQAPNRRHDLRTWFGPDGIRVEDRTSRRSLLALRLAAFGRPGALQSVSAGEVRSEGARVEIHRPGLLEWYGNTPQGLEQGFTLAHRPAGAGPLWVELALEGASASARGQALRLRTTTGRTLTYGKLAAWDADGVPLEAALSAPAPDRIRLVLADTAARYPVVVDPLLTAAPDTQIEADQTGARLGVAVAGAGDVNGDGYGDVLVGAPEYDAGQTNEGAAFVFLGAPAGIADAAPISAQTQLESDQADADFGQSVAGAGDVNGDGYGDVLVGAPGYDAGEANEGAAFVFLGGPAGVVDAGAASAQAQLEADQADAELGFSVAGAGDVDGDGYADVLVGARRFDVLALVNAGAAFLFHGSASGISGTSPLDADGELRGSLVGEGLGHAVAGAGDVDGDGYADVLVGATESSNAEPAAFVFRGGVSGVGTLSAASAHAQLRCNDEALPQGGISVDSAGDVNGDGYADVVVGCPFAFSSPTTIGAAALFHGSAGGVAGGDLSTADTRIDPSAFTFLGWSAAGAGDVNADGYADVVVADTNGGVFATGQAYVFLGGPGGIPDGIDTDAYARLGEGIGGGSFGYAIAGAGDVNGDGFDDVIAGDPFFGAGQSDEGGAFVFLGGGAGFHSVGPATASTRLESNQASSAFGFSVAGAGDVNGDGFADVIVGADDYDAGEADEGAAFVFLGSAAGIVDAIPVSAHAQLEGDQAGAAFGVSVAGAGDVDRDGYEDVLVGASGYDDALVDEGGAFLFRGSAAGIASGDPGTADARLVGGQAGALFGRSVASAGDVNGDGFVDVVVGANGWDGPESVEGAAFLFLGGASGLADASAGAASATFQSDQSGAQMGTSVASAGDVNGDGHADLIVGAERYNAGLSQEGAAFVFLGSGAGIASGNPGTAHAQLEGDQQDAFFGAAVAGAGDVNADGYGDVIVGAYGYDAGEVNEGAAFVFHGSAAGIASGGPASAATWLEGDQTGASFGRGVAGAGDVDGDGFADVVVGGHLFDQGGTNNGAAAIFTGGPAGISSGNLIDAHASFFGADGSFAGHSVAGAGDVDGDGFADVIVGAERYEAGQVQEGGAFVIRGNRGGGRALQPAQRTILGGRIPSWGATFGTSFEVAMRATHPEGHGLVALDVEICPAGSPFGAVGCDLLSSADWTEVGGAAGPEVLLDLETGDLDEGALVRWRARVVRAPLAIGLPGISEPPAPAHGPWRRPFAQAVEGDVRVLPEPGTLPGLACGLLALRALARRRVRRG